MHVRMESIHHRVVFGGSNSAEIDDWPTRQALRCSLGSAGNRFGIIVWVDIGSGIGIGIGINVDVDVDVHVDADTFFAHRTRLQPSPLATLSDVASLYSQSSSNPEEGFSG